LLVPLTCRTLFTFNGIKMVKFSKEWIDYLNLIPSGATSGKRGSIRWEGRGEGCEYSRFQGGNPAYVD
jgi:hypothetical protein